MNEEEFVRNYWSQDTRAVDTLLLPPELGARTIEGVNEALRHGWRALAGRSAERERMIMENQGLVWQVVLRVAPPTRREEALSHGQEGLIFAVDRFDPSRGTKFSSYAYKCIWGYVLRGLYLRPAHWKPQIPVDFAGEYGEAGAAPEPEDHRVESPDRPAFRADVWARIRKYLDPRRYEAIFEYYAHGKTYDEIALRLGVTRQRTEQLVATGLQHMLNRIPDLAELLS